MSKRIWCMILTAVMLVGMCVMPTQAAEENTFAGYTPISTKEQLDAIRNDLKGKYYLTTDIVFTDADFAPGGAFYNGGNLWIPIGTPSKPFKGVLDGNGYTITNLRVNVNSTGDVYGGLFGYVSNSRSDDGIFNLGLIGGKVEVYTSRGTCHAGAIAGYQTIGLISGCYNTGEVSSKDSFGTAYTGGLIGFKEFGEILRCYNTGTVSGKHTVGGIVGNVTAVYVTDCYSTVSVNGSYAGGIIGSCSFGKAERCYSLGGSDSFYGFGFGGGIVGLNMNGNVIDCYYRSSSASGGGAQKTDAAMKEQSTFVGFDFENVWTMGGNPEYPYPELRNMARRGDMNQNGFVDNNDVVGLLWHTLFPERNPIEINGDLDGDGFVDNSDVVYLLWHCLFPERNPL